MYVIIYNYYVIFSFCKEFHKRRPTLVYYIGIEIHQKHFTSRATVFFIELPAGDKICVRGFLFLLRLSILLPLFLKLIFHSFNFKIIKVKSINCG